MGVDFDKGFEAKPEDYVFRVVKDDKTGKESIKSEETGVITWLKANVFDRDSYKLSKIAQVVKNLQQEGGVTSKDITLLMKKINVNKYEEGNPKDAVTAVVLRSFFINACLSQLPDFHRNISDKQKINELIENAQESRVLHWIDPEAKQGYFTRSELRGGQMLHIPVLLMHKDGEAWCKFTQDGQEKEMSMKEYLRDVDNSNRSVFATPKNLQPIPALPSKERMAKLREKIKAKRKSASPPVSRPSKETLKRVPKDEPQVPKDFKKTQQALSPVSEKRKDLEQLPVQEQRIVAVQLANALIKGDQEAIQTLRSQFAFQTEDLAHDLSVSFALEFIQDLNTTYDSKKLSRDFEFIKLLYSTKNDPKSSFDQFFDDLLMREFQFSVPANDPEFLSRITTICQDIGKPELTAALFGRCFSNFLQNNRSITSAKLDYFLEQWKDKELLTHIKDLHIGHHDRDMTTNSFRRLVQNLPNLEHINLRGHFENKGQRNDDDLVILSQHCKKLKSINVGNQEHITTKGLTKFVQNCKNLENITIFGSPGAKNLSTEFIGALSELSSLRSFCFDKYSELPPEERQKLLNKNVEISQKH